MHLQLQSSTPPQVEKEWPAERCSLLPRCHISFLTFPRMTNTSGYFSKKNYIFDQKWYFGPLTNAIPPIAVITRDIERSNT